MDLSTTSRLRVYFAAADGLDLQKALVGRFLPFFFLAVATLSFCLAANAQVTGPGGVSDADVWVKSDDAGDIATAWKDQSINNNPIESVGSWSLSPATRSHNFHPYTTGYTTSRYFRDGLSSIQTTLPSSVSVFSSVRRTATTQGRITGIDDNATYADEPGFSVTAQGLPLWYKYTYGVDTQTHSTPLTINQTTLPYFIADQTAKTIEVGLDGQFSSGTFNNQGVIGRSLLIGYGSWTGNTEGPFPGDIMEIIWFTKALTDNERDRVNSYLAVKYGTTLDVNYLNSAGGTFWNQTNNSGYNNNIASVGRDDASGLHQKQSNSVNSGDQVIMALGGTVATSNANNSNTFSVDRSFLTWGDNAAATTFSNTITISSGAETLYFNRMARTWKLQESGTVPDVTIAFPYAATGDLNLIISDTPDFSGTNTRIAMQGTQTIDGTAYRLTDSLVDFGGNQYFTFAEEVPSPLIVTSTADTNTIGTLRYAINHANANAADDIITFNIPGLGPHVISPTSALPTITDDGITIDGSTQGSTVCNGTPNSTGGMSNRRLRIVLFGTNHSSNALSISGASNVTIKGLTIGNSAQSGIYADTADGLTLLCNHLGTSTDTTGSIGNNANGARILNSDNVIIGDGTLEGANVVGFNSGSGIYFPASGPSNNPSIKRNFLGVGADGISDIGNSGNGLYLAGTSGAMIGGSIGEGNIASGNTTYGIRLTNGNNIDIRGNYLGTSADGLSAIPNQIGLYVTSGSNIRVGDSLNSNRNIISGNTNDATIFISTSNSEFAGNYVGVDATGNTPLANGWSGVAIQNSTNISVGGTLSEQSNVIAAGTAGSGVYIYGGSSGVSIEGNLIGWGANGITALGHAHAGVFVDNSQAVIGGATTASKNRIGNNGYSGVVVIGTTSVAAILGNDMANNTQLGIDLNFNNVTNNDTNDTDTGPNDLLNFPVINEIAVNGSNSVNYDISLDVPSHSPGYRVEFFKNSAADPTNHGEGETFLGAIDVSGTGNHTGTFTANASVSAGDIISTTATRKTVSSFDFTSEFSQTFASVSYISPLVVTSAADTNTIGTLRYAINHANANAADDIITFNIAGAGPHTITLSSALPTIGDDGVTIDGTTQSGASCGDLWAGTPHTLMVRIDSGSTSDPFFDGFSISSDNVTIRGLSITRFNDGVRVLGSADAFSTQCSYYGVAPDGAAAGHYGVGIALLGSNALIGGLTAGDGNVVSGTGFTAGILTHDGSSGTMIRGNFIGTDPTGMTTQPNDSGIGNWTGTATWSDIRKNLISGNDTFGIVLNTDDTVSGVSGDVVIAGNYIGVDRTGNTALANSGGIFFASGSLTGGLTIGGTNASDRNVISANGDDGVDLNSISDVSILGNYLGIGSDGTTDLGNTRDGINLFGGSNITIGGTVSGARNVISGNQLSGIDLDNVSGVNIEGNYIGVDAAGTTAIANGVDGIEVTGNSSSVTIGSTTSGGGNVLSGNVDDGIDVPSGSSVSVIGNFIGTDPTGTIAVGNSDEGVVIRNSVTSVSVGDGTTEGRNIIAGNGSANILVRDDATSIIDTNLIGVGAGGESLGGGEGIRYVGSGGSTALNNTIANTSGDGVFVSTTSAVALTGNSIFNNSGLGINLDGGIEDGNGVTANDSGDGDTGPNDLLNYPVINEVNADGTTSVSYDFDLDVPTNANGYRIEFFKSTSADASGYGEGEIYLGSVDVSGTGNHTGSFTASETVSDGDIISLTTTRKTGATTYDITSEFSAALAAIMLLPDLQVSMTATVYDPGASGLFATPSNDVVYTLSVTNTGNGSVDDGTIDLMIPIKSETTFYNDDFDGAGPETSAVIFNDSSSGLSFNPSTHLAFSDSGTKPASFAACTYTPSVGYDPAVTYVCINPAGAMQAGDPDPSFNFQFRTRID